MNRPRSTQRALIIAEVGSVHDGSFGNACKLIETAAQCQADAVKFQTHIAEAETLPTAPDPCHFKDEPRFDYFKRTAFRSEQWHRLAEIANDNQIQFLSSPFSVEAVDLLEELTMPIYKVASGEVTNLPLLQRIASTGKPVILSSGMSSWKELDLAVAIFRDHQTELTLLQCSSEYPCADERMGLNVMQEMADRYSVPVGLSDHTLAPYAAYAAVCMGATVIEKHLTFSRLMYGSDAKNATEPQPFRQMVDGVRAIERMLQARVDKNDLSPYADMKKVFEKSLVSRCDITKGTRIDQSMLTTKKPGTGIPPSDLNRVIGTHAAHDILQNSMLRWEDLKIHERNL